MVLPALCSPQGSLSKPLRSLRDFLFTSRAVSGLQGTVQGDGNLSGITEEVFLDHKRLFTENNIKYF